MTKKITKISAQKIHGRYNLELDGKFAFGITEMTLIKFGLAKNRELDDQEVSTIKKFEESARALSRGLTFLSHHLRTEKELRDKLRSQHFDAEAIDSAVTHLKEEKYIDDRIYAENFVHTQARLLSVGPLVISRKLQALGIAPADIQAAMQDYKTDNQAENALALAEKFQKHYAKNPAMIQRQKINQALYGKGYDADLIKTVLEKLDFSEDPDVQLENARRVLARIWPRYSKYGRERPYKARQYLYGKGFSAELIDKVIGEQGD
ncbi:recombination regulator RecX [Oenococcus sp.]|uniref:recombination regulator RecX n=1 Tax=Oenococcus sp. TaxID=1979414 RepID=UPI0039E9AF6F